MHAAAVGEGRLTAVNNNGYDLVVSGDADHGAAVTVGVVGAGSVRGNVCTVNNEHLRTADGVLYSAVRCDRRVVFGVVGAAKGGAVCKNGEPRTVVRVVHHLAVDGKGAGRTTGLHVVEVAVGTGNNGVIFTDEIRIGRISEFCGC